MMMKKLFIPLALTAALFACGNDDSKIEALEQKLNEQEQAIQEEKQADLERELSDKNAEIDRLKGNGNKSSEQTFHARGSGDYPEASQRILSYDDLAGMSKRELRFMRNEIFARYGYIFKSQDLKDHFLAQSWYQPLYNDVNHRLTRIEKENADYIKAFE
jgi:hypothetical protein